MPLIIEKVVEFMLNHEHVKESPIASDTLLIEDPETKQRKRIHKLILEIPIRELHNDLVAAAERGDLGEGFFHNGRFVITDTSLRRLLPPNIRRATERHKQMCGCEACLSIRMLHDTLKAFRSRMTKKIEKEAREESDQAKKEEKQKKHQTYKNLVYPEGKKWHDMTRDAVKEILCLMVEDVGHHKFCCVLRECKECPSYPTPELERDKTENAPTINFHKYNNTTTCSKHGILDLYSKTCKECDALDEGKKKGKVSTRKKLTLFTEPIGAFITDHYLPALEKYAYHNSHVKILSKAEGQCGSMRKEVIKKNVKTINTHRDYAERILAVLTDEIQSEHFGNSRDLSIEGSVAIFYPKSEIDKYERGEKTLEELEPIMESHSHFSDDKEQNAATTYNHFKKLIEVLRERSVLVPGTVIIVSTDGCAKQYRCANSIYLNSVLSATYQITIDQMIGAPGHGKDIVDGINAVDKKYIRIKMCQISTPEASESEKLMKPHAIVDGEDGKAFYSFAAEAKRLCEMPDRIEGTKSYKKSNKREQNAPLKRREYYLHDAKDQKYNQIHMKLNGLRKEKYHGLTAMYNVRTDPDLGIGKAAVHRIPCACDGCLEQLNKEWQKGIPPEDQERYKTSEKCKFHSILAGLNDWAIVNLVPSQKSDEEQVADTQDVVLSELTTQIAEEIEVGNVAAFMTDDEDADGFYLVDIIEEPYTLQEDIELEGGAIIPAGQMVSKGRYWSRVPRTARFYTTNELQYEEIIQVKHIVAANVLMEKISDKNKLPNGYPHHLKHKAINDGARSISSDSYEEIKDEISRREPLDHEYIVESDESDEEDAPSEDDSSNT